MRVSSRNNIIAGAFLLIALVLAVTISIILSNADQRIRSTKNYIVRFSLASGTHGLKSGSQVLLGGQPVGWVRSVDVSAGPDGLPGWVDIGVAVRSDLRLFESAIATLERPLLGSTSAINFVNPGSPDRVASPTGQGPELESGEVIAGQIAAPSFLAGAGYGQDQAEQLRSFTKNASEGAEKLNKVIEQFAADMPALLADVRESTKTIRERVPQWRDQVDQTLANGQRASERLDPLFDEAGAGISDARRVIASAQATIDENRPKITSSLDSIQSAADKLDHQTVGELNVLITDAREAVKRFGASVAELAGWFAQENPSLSRMIANFRLASDQLRLTSVEVRQAPWKLLYQPKTKELENEALYDAARTYAQAVSDLRAAGEAIDSALRSPGAAPLDVERIKALRERLDGAFAKYEEAERHLLTRMGSK
jgi:ABC-type transporter Mla subunit MlaD